MSTILTFSIQSGSNGNCIYVEAGDTRLLIDAGVSGRTLRERMSAHGRSPDEIDALLISHEHDDHIRCAGIYQRKFGMPVYMTRPTLAAARAPLGPMPDVCFFRSGDTLTIKDVTIYTVRTPHDAVDGVVFIIEFDGRRLGVLTDLGHAFSGLVELLEAVDAAYLESNYDADMLAGGPYPEYLKRRIAGAGGHVSNGESASLVRLARSKRHQWIALSHLSEQNNHPDLALAEHRRVMGNAFPVDVSSRTSVSALRVV